MEQAAATADLKQSETLHARARDGQLDCPPDNAPGAVAPAAPPGLPTPPAVDAAAWDEPIPTDAEARVLHVIADPDHFNHSMEQKAAAAGMSRTTWWRVTHGEGFEDRARKYFARALSALTGPVLQALATSAATGDDPRCATDRRVFLELVGVYQPGGAAAAAKGEEKKSHVYDFASDAELIVTCHERGLPLPPGVERRARMAGLLPPATPAAGGTDATS